MLREKFEEPRLDMGKLKNAFHHVKKRFREFYNLSNQSGFGIDACPRKITASKDALDAYIQVRTLRSRSH